MEDWVCPLTIEDPFCDGKTLNLCPFVCAVGNFVGAKFEEFRTWLLLLRIFYGIDRVGFLAYFRASAIGAFRGTFVSNLRRDCKIALH